MNLGHPDKDTAIPVIVDFTDIPQSNDIAEAQWQKKIVLLAQSFRLRNMIDVAEVYARLMKKDKKETITEFNPVIGESITLPVIREELSITSINEIYKELISSALITHILFTNGAFRVPYSKAKSDMFSVTFETGSSLFNRIAPQLLYRNLSDKYINILQGVNEWYGCRINEYGGLRYEL